MKKIIILTAMVLILSFVTYSYITNSVKINSIDSSYNITQLMPTFEIVDDEPDFNISSVLYYNISAVDVCIVRQIDNPGDEHKAIPVKLYDNGENVSYMDVFHQNEDCKTLRKFGNVNFNKFKIGFNSINITIFWNASVSFIRSLDPRGDWDNNSNPDLVVAGSLDNLNFYWLTNGSAATMFDYTNLTADWITTVQWFSTNTSSSYNHSVVFAGSGLWGIYNLSKRGLDCSDTLVNIGDIDVGYRSSNEEPLIYIITRAGATRQAYIYNKTCQMEVNTSLITNSYSTGYTIDTNADGYSDGIVISTRNTDDTNSSMIFYNNGSAKLIGANSRSFAVIPAELYSEYTGQEVLVRNTFYIEAYANSNLTNYIWQLTLNPYQTGGLGSLTTCDINGDGKQEIIEISQNQTAPKQDYVYILNSSGSILSGLPVWNAGNDPIDLNELICGNFTGNNNGVYTAFGGGDKNITIANKTSGYEANFSASGSIGINYGSDDIWNIKSVWGIDSTKDLLMFHDNNMIHLLNISNITISGVTDLIPNLTSNLTNNSIYLINNNINFTFNASDDNNLTNVSLLINGLVNYTLVNPVNNSDITQGINITLVDGVYNWSLRATDNANQMNTTDLRRIYISLNNPNVTLLNPADLNQTSNNNITFNASVNTTGASVNATLYTNVTGLWLPNQTINLNGNTNITNITFLVNNFQSVNYTLWNVLVCDSENTCRYSITNRSFMVDATKPIVNFSKPTDDSGTVAERYRIVFNITTYDDNFLNVTAYIYNSTFSLMGTANSTEKIFTFNFTGLRANETYFFNATAYDILENLGYSETRNITLNFSFKHTGTGGLAGGGYTPKNVTKEIEEIEVKEIKKPFDYKKSILYILLGILVYNVITSKGINYIKNNKIRKNIKIMDKPKERKQKSIKPNWRNL